MRTPVAALLAIVIIAFYCNDAAADVAYSNLGPGNTFNTMVGLIVEGQHIPFNLPQTIADSFTSQVTGNISSVDVAVSGIADFNVSLQLNNPVTNLPLTSSNIFLGTVTASSINYTLVTLTSVTPVTLVLGRTILVGTFSGGNTQGAWALAINQSANPAAYSHDNGQTFMFTTEPRASAFRINAASVPGPSAFALIGTGTILVWSKSRLKHRSGPSRESV